MSKKLFYVLAPLTLVFCLLVIAFAPVSPLESGWLAFFQQQENRFASFCVGSFIGFSCLTGIALSFATRPIRRMLSLLQIDSLARMGIEMPQVRDEFEQIARVVSALSKRCQEQKEALNFVDLEREALIECLEEGVVVFDTTLRIKIGNRAATKILKVPKDELEGKTVQQLVDKIPMPIWKKSQELLRKSLETQSVVAGTLHGESQGKSHISLRSIPLPRGLGIVLVLQDTSSQYKVLEMGRDFVANASHELRTPITIIKGFAETLRDVPEISGAMLEDITEKIVRNCQRMNNLVKNLLILADLDNFTKAHLQPCDLVGLIDNCNQTLLALYPQAIVETLYNKQEIIIQADPDLFELALTNLLQNAAKYSRDDPQIQVTLEEKEAEVMLSIADKGIGIPGKDLPYIFDRFYTVDKTHSRKLGGAGLGLSIVKRIIEKHEGSIHASSVLGQGTTFTIILPK